jgi:hypothetical protein
MPVIERDEPDGGEELLPLEFRLRVNEPCWLEIRADGDVVVQGLMLAGYEKQFGAHREIHLWLGNAGGVSYWINGQPGKSLGHAGQVRKEIRITPENLSEFVAS